VKPPLLFGYIRIFAIPGVLKLKTPVGAEKCSYNYDYIYEAVWWCPRVCLATVRADLGHLQRLAYVSIRGSISTAPWMLLRLVV
jgi:hypothetical protein